MDVSSPPAEGALNRKATFPSRNRSDPMQVTGMFP